MSNQDDAVRRAIGALRPEADEADAHPGIEALEAYVEGRLTPEERAGIDALAARSSIVAEDLADLRAVHEQLAPSGRRVVRWGRIAAGLGIAASLTIAVWLFSRPALAPGRPSPVAAAALTAAERQQVDAALAAGRIALPAPVAALIRPQGTLLGTPATQERFGPVGPVGTSVRSARPSFTWSDAGADAYTVAVFDENFKEIARSERVKGTSWAPSADLPRGVPLVWQITAHRGASSETEPKPPQPEARFAVLDAALAARIDEQASRLANEPLALGVLYAEAGLLADAREELTRAAATPATAEAARRLLLSLTPQELMP